MNPPLMPCFILGIRMVSQNRSQLSLESWTATTVQPTRRLACGVEQLPFWQVVLRDMHSREYRVVLRLRATGEVMHYSVLHWRRPLMLMEPAVEMLLV